MQRSVLRNPVPRRPSTPAGVLSMLDRFSSRCLPEVLYFLLFPVWSALSSPRAISAYNSVSVVIVASASLLVLVLSVFAAVVLASKKRLSFDVRTLFLGLGLDTSSIFNEQDGAMAKDFAAVATVLRRWRGRLILGAIPGISNKAVRNQ